MTTNKDLIEKATITTDALASAGALNAEQADKFLDYVIDETQLKGLGLRFEKFDAENKDLDKINVANRVAVPAAEATDPGIRRGVTTSKITLAPKEIMCPFEIGDLFRQRAIEDPNMAADTVIRLMATRLANNLEELWLDGNTLGSAKLESDLIEGGSGTLYRKDNYLALFNGWLKAAEAGHVVDAANAQISPTLISKTFRALPTKFRKNKSALRLLCSWDHEVHYAEGVSARGTLAGDRALEGGAISPFGVPMFPVALLDAEPEYVEHVVVNTDGSTATALSYAPITNVVVTTPTLGNTPEAAYILATDYNQDLTNGTITRLGGGAIPSGGTVKVSYNTAGRAILTMPKNMIVALSRNIAIEKQRNIYKRVDEYAIHASAYVTFEETDAVALLKNIQVPA